MAEPIGIASGLLALAGFALKSSIALCNTISGIQKHPKRVIELIEELNELRMVLTWLTETLSTDSDIDLSKLELPLKRCGTACDDFRGVLAKCAADSGSPLASFKGWARLKYMGENVDGFRQMLAGYKSTIGIALHGAHLHKSTATLDNLEAFRQEVKNATDNLEEHLDELKMKFESLVPGTVADPGNTSSDDAELRLIQEERLATESSLQICAELSEHLSQIRLRPVQRHRSSPGNVGSAPVPERIINEGLRDMQESLSSTTGRLQIHLEDVLDRLLAKSRSTSSSEEDMAEVARLREGLRAAHQCLEICAGAEKALRENACKVDNYASGDDNVQLLVSTSSQPVHGVNKLFGSRTQQFGGYIDGETLRSISQLNARITSQVPGGDDVRPQPDAAAIPDNALRKEFNPGLWTHHGPGVKLKSQSVPDVKPTELAAERRATVSPKR